MAVYLVRTDIDYEIPVIWGYYSTRKAAEDRRLVVSAREDVSYNEADIIVEEITIDEDVQPVWL